MKLLKVKLADASTPAEVDVSIDKAIKAIHKIIEPINEARNEIDTITKKGLSTQARMLQFKALRGQLNEAQNILAKVAGELSNIPHNSEGGK